MLYPITEVQSDCRNNFLQSAFGPGPKLHSAFPRTSLVVLAVSCMLKGLWAFPVEQFAFGQCLLPISALFQTISRAFLVRYDVRFGVETVDNALYISEASGKLVAWSVIREVAQEPSPSQLSSVSGATMQP